MRYLTHDIKRTCAPCLRKKGAVSRQNEGETEATVIECPEEHSLRGEVVVTV